MCNELRGASRKEMHDFILGKPVAPVVQGNCVELLDSPEAKVAATTTATKINTGNNNNNTVVQETPNTTVDHHNASKENRHNHKAPISLPKPMAKKNPYFKPGGGGGGVKNNNSANTNKPRIVPNPYFKGGHQPHVEPQQQKCENQIAVMQRQRQQQQQQPSNQTQQLPATAIHTDKGKENKILQQPPSKQQQQQHFFFDKKPAALSKGKSASRRKSRGHPTVHRYSFSPGPVPHDPQKALTYIYPKHPDYPTREYQLDITETALNYNTLVSLPTGLGKTHIAAVVMYNYFRWFSNSNSAASGKIIFLAPTLPLVHQQIEACYKITGIPGHETAVLTGKLKAGERKALWKSKRVFYCTPQTVQRDLLAACGSGILGNEEEETDPETALAFSRVVCLVLDEAHKATGDYAYTKVVELLEKAAGAKFRIIGLSATPGTSIKNIQGVIETLRSCRIEARTDADPTVAPYLHTKRTEIVICPRNTSQNEVIRKLSNILQPLLERLRQEGGLQTYGNDTMTSYSILKARQLYETRMRANNGQRPNGGLVACFHATHQLVQIRNDCHQGLGVVKTKLLRLKNVPQRGMLSTVVKSDDFSEVVETVLDATSGEGSCENVVDPKLAKLCELLKHHFERNNACNHSSRAIVFAQFRDSVKEIVNCLESNLKPLVRSRYFVGQNKGAGTATSKGGRKSDEKVHGMKQAEQQKAIKDFRNNVFNVLVCTSIGEEGLDIGDVDLIINYDVISSPIRTIQRAGRTGRKRDGRVVSLIAEGLEEKTYKRRLVGEKTLHNALKDPKKFVMASHYPMLPHAPEKEYKAIEIKAKLALSEVAGAQHTPGASKTEKKKKSWRLDASEEYERETLCGEMVSLNEDMTWERLKGFFCKNRVDPSKLQGIRKTNRLLLSLGREDRKRLLKARHTIRQKQHGNRSNGRIKGILESIQSYGSVHFEGTTRSGYRDILSIFPVDPVAEMQKPNSSRVGKKLWENSPSRNDNKQLPPTTASATAPFAAESRSISNFMNRVDDVPKSISGREIAPNELASGGVSNLSHTGVTTLSTSLFPNDVSNLGGKTLTEESKIQNFVDNRHMSALHQKAAPETVAFRLETPPPSSDDDSSVGPESEQNTGFRLPTQSSSSDSNSDDDENMGGYRDANPMAMVMPHIEVLDNKENKITNSNDNSIALSHQTSFKSEPHQKDPEIQTSVQNPIESADDNLNFRFPTPPPSSSSSSSEEEDNDDSDTITVPEPKPIQEICSENPARNDQDIQDAKLNDYEAQNVLVTNKFSPPNERIASTPINIEDTKLKPTETKHVKDNFSIPAGNTPNAKISIGFEDENDIALSSLKSKFCSKSKKDTFNKTNIDPNDSEEDVPLVSFRNKNENRPNTSRKKLLDDFSLVALRGNKRKKSFLSKGDNGSDKELPSGVSFGKSPWEVTSGDNESEEDTLLISFSNKKKNKSLKMTYDIPLIDLCDKKKKNSVSSKNIDGANKQALPLLSSGKNDIIKTGEEKEAGIEMGEKEKSKNGAGILIHPPVLGTIDNTSIHLNQDSSLESMQSSNPIDAVNRSKRGENDIKRLRILETPDSKSVHLSTGPTSIQKESQHEIVDYSTNDINRTKYPRILETPDSTSVNLHVGLSSKSTQEPSENEIICHSKNIKTSKRLRIGSEDSDKEHEKSCDSISLENSHQSYSKSTPDVTSYQFASGVLEDTPQTCARGEYIGMRKRDTSDFLTDTPIDNAFKNVAKDIVCEVCASGDSTDANPLVLCDACNLGFHKNCSGINVDIESEDPWYCDSCIDSSASKKDSDHILSSPRPKKLHKKSAKASSKPRKPVSRDSKEDIVGEMIHLDDTDDEEESPRTKKHRLRERRRQGLAKFVLDEAEMGSDQEGDDADEEEDLRRLEEEEEDFSQDSFINDNHILTQHFSQDVLGELDPDASSIGGNPNGTPGINQTSHRALDAQRERENHFKTPNFNRRMMRPNPGFSSTPSSAQGLGNMNFIRSVLEHHRNGGDSDQIEAEYKRIEASSAPATANSPLETTPATMASNPNRDDDCIDLTTTPENNGTSSTPRDFTNTNNYQSNGNRNGNRHPIRNRMGGRPPQHQQPPQNGGLTADQLARIEANRQAALRKRLAKKQQNENAKT